MTSYLNPIQNRTTSPNSFAYSPSKSSPKSILKKSSNLSDRRLSPEKPSTVRINEAANKISGSTSAPLADKMVMRKSLLEKADEIIRNAPQNQLSNRLSTSEIRNSVPTTRESVTIKTIGASPGRGTDPLARSTKLLNQINDILDKSNSSQVSSERGSVRSTTKEVTTTFVNRPPIINVLPPAPINSNTSNIMKLIDETLKRSSQITTYRSLPDNDIPHNTGLKTSQNITTTQTVSQRSPRTSMRSNEGEYSEKMERTRSSSSKERPFSSVISVQPLPQEVPRQTQLSQHIQSQDSHYYLPPKNSSFDLKARSAKKNEDLVRPSEEVSRSFNGRIETGSDVLNRPLKKSPENLRLREEMIIERSYVETSERKSAAYQIPARNSITNMTPRKDEDLKKSEIIYTLPKEEAPLNSSKTPPRSDNNNSNAENKSNYVEEVYPDNTKYQGEKQGHLRHGRGEMIYADGTSYSGEWRNDKRNGFGMLMLPNEQVEYSGEWKDDIFHGTGILVNQYPQRRGDFDLNNFDTLRNQWTRYEGDFKDGKKHGVGTLILMDGGRFSGRFAHDMVNGPGTLRQADGSTIVGEWKNNKLVQIL